MLSQSYTLVLNNKHYLADNSSRNIRKMYFSFFEFLDPRIFPNLKVMYLKSFALGYLWLKNCELELANKFFKKVFFVRILD